MKIKNGEILSFSEALYKAQCPICGGLLNWEADFDADGTDYYAECCKKTFCMVSYKVKIEISDE